MIIFFNTQCLHIELKIIHSNISNNNCSNRCSSNYYIKRCRSPPPIWLWNSIRLEVLYIEKSFRVDDCILTRYAEEDRYTIVYKGSSEEHDITKSIYDLYKESELQQEAERNELRRHIDSSEIEVDNIYEKLKNKPLSVAEIVQDKEFEEKVRTVKATFTQKQLERFEKYFEQELTYQAIADSEGLYFTTIRDSIDLALKKFKKVFKTYRKKWR